MSEEILEEIHTAAKLILPVALNINLSSRNFLAENKIMSSIPLDDIVIIK